MKAIIFFLLLTTLPALEANEELFPDKVDSGYVLFQFDISKEGEAKNIKVAEDYPKGVFAESALQALKKWTFKVKYIDGESVVQKI